VPYALEGLVRRELEAVAAQLLSVEHASVVTLRFALPEPEAATLVHRLGDRGQGQLQWLDTDNAGHV